MFKGVDKINIPKNSSLDITNIIDIISINELLENDSDVICFSYIPESGLTKKENELIEDLRQEDFKIDFVLTLDKEKFYIIRKNTDIILA